MVVEPRRRPLKISPKFVAQLSALKKQANKETNEKNSKYDFLSSVEIKYITEFERVCKQQCAKQ